MALPYALSQDTALSQVQEPSDHKCSSSTTEYSFVSWTTARQPQDRRTQSIVKARVMRNLRKHKHWTGGRKRRDAKHAQQETDSVPRAISNQLSLSHEIRDPSLNRMQLRSKAADLFFGELSGRALTTRYLDEIAATDRLLEMTLDAYNLICIGRVSGDGELLRHGIGSYTLALRETRIRLRSVDEEDCKRLICVTHVFQICEELLSPSEKNTPNAHTDAQAGLARGICPRKLPRGLRLLLLCNFRLFAIWDALSTYGEVGLPPDDRLGDGDSPTDEGTLVSIACISGNASRLLYRARQLQKNPDRTSAELFRSYVALCDLERKLHRWAVQFHADRPTTRVDLNAFVPAGWIENEGTIGDAYRFRNSATASAYLVYAGTLLSIQIECEAISRLVTDIDPESATAPRKAPLEAIEELCKSLPYFCEPQRGLFGAIQARVPLRLARDACHVYGLVHLERWCKILQTRMGVFSEAIPPRPDVNADG